MLQMHRRFCCYVIVGIALIMTGCAAPARAALPSPDPGVRGTPVCPERAGQLLHAAINSTIYSARVAVNVYVPPCYARGSAPLPVIYLLHGGNADETQWPDLQVEQSADALIARGAAPFVVVMPGGDYHATIDYAAFVLSDLLPEVERQFRVSSAGADRAIGGISLGGYWALKIAFSRPELFAAAGGHSPVADRGQNGDPLALARTGDGLQRLAVTLDVGAADALGTSVARLAHVLQERAISIAFSSRPGAHDRSYWRAHTSEYLQFYCAALQHDMGVPPGRCSGECTRQRVAEHISALNHHNRLSHMSGLKGYCNVIIHIHAAPTPGAFSGRPEITPEQLSANSADRASNAVMVRNGAPWFIFRLPGLQARLTDIW